MNDKMVMKWKDVFTDETCSECLGYGKNYDDIYSVETEDFFDVYIPDCHVCLGEGKKIDIVKYNEYMSEYSEE